MLIKSRNINDVIILDIGGRFCRSDVAEPTLQAMVEAQLENGKLKVLINCEKLEFIDSFGVACILECIITTKKRGGELLICSRRAFLELLQRPLVTPISNLCESEESALGRFGVTH